MKYRKLGKRGPVVSAIGMGCMGMSHAYGAPIGKREAAELLAKAIDLGYTFFDTAEVYGTADCPHHNEELLGELLKPFRKKIVLSTKFGMRFDMESGRVPYPLIPDSSRDSIRRSVEGSLSRLQTDHIDIYYQHRPDPNVPIEEVAGVVQDLIKEGKILYWGLSEAPVEDIRRADAVCPLTAIQNRYSMMARWHETLFPVLEELGIGFVAFSPLANGLLSDRYTVSSHFDAGTDYRASMPQFRSESYDKNHALMELLRRMAEEKNATPAQVSLAWMLCKKPWIVPIPGTRKVERLQENAGAAEIVLTSEEVSQIDRTLDAISMSDVFGGTKVER